MKFIDLKSMIILLPSLIFFNTIKSQTITASLAADKSISIETSKNDASVNNFSQFIIRYTTNNGKDSLPIVAAEFTLDTITRLQKQDMAFRFEKDGKVTFLNHRGLDRVVLFCEKCKCFAIKECPNSIAKKLVTDIKNNEIPADFPFPPQFSPQSENPSALFPVDNIEYYHLVIDANPNILCKKNNTLYERYTRQDDQVRFKIVRSLKVNSSLGIFISNYNFASLEDVSVSVNGNDYHYEKGIGDIYSAVVPGKGEKKEGADSSAKATATDLQDSLQTIKNNLSWVYDTYLNKYTSLNINDIILLNKYKASLSKFYVAHAGLFNIEAVDLMNKILVWSPQLVSLSPIAVTIPDSDEVEIEVKIKEKDIAEEKYPVGTYYTRGKAAVIAGAKGSLFFTNLKNNEAYIDSSDHRAKLDNKHQVSVGIGASGILSFRTGTAWTPTINLGFFIPLGEDIAPFGYFGPGINYGTQKVSFNLSAGLAFGKINEIKTSYKGIDMRTIQNLDVNGITDKVWKTGWAVSLGMSFNLSK